MIFETLPWIFFVFFTFAAYYFAPTKTKLKINKWIGIPK